MTRWLRFTSMCCLGAMLFYAMGCGSGTRPYQAKPGVPLIVQRTLPTNGQEVLPDLSDPGLNGVIEVKFSTTLMKADVLDPNNSFNGLTSYVNILDSNLARVPGTPSITGARKNILTFVPGGGGLPNGQYTITVKRDVRSAIGLKLNNGLYDSRSSFTVGTDVYSPIIRDTFPEPNQTDVPKDSQIVVTMNESVNPATVSNATFTVVNGGVNPPVAIQGTVTVSRDNFDLVFTPSVQNPMPPNSTIVVTLTGGPSGITDALGNPFEGNPATAPTYQFQFQTVKEPPLPNNPPVTDSWNCANIFATTSGIWYTTGTSVGTVGDSAYIASTLASQPDLTLYAANNPIANSLTKVGSPGKVVIDGRADATTGASTMYVVDRNSGDVVVMNSLTMRVLTRWTAFGVARGLAIQNGGPTGLFYGGPGNPVLVVSNFAANSISVVGIGGFPPGPNAATQAMKDADLPANRTDYDTDAGPGPVMAFPLVAITKPSVLVGCQLADTLTEIDLSTGTVLSRESLTGMPVQIAGTRFLFPPPSTPFGWFAFISEQTSTGGSVAMYWDDTLTPPQPAGRKQSIAGELTGFNDPEGIQWDYNFTTSNSGNSITSFWVANSGGDTISKLGVTITGGGFTTTMQPTLDGTVTVGRNPSTVCFDAASLVNAVCGLTPVLVTADQGDGTMTFVRTNGSSVPYHLPVPGVRTVYSIFSQ